MFSISSFLAGLGPVIPRKKMAKQKAPVSIDKPILRWRKCIAISAMWFLVFLVFAHPYGDKATKPS
jgi:hypothetical protein